MRLSPAGVESRSYEIKDGDIIQLGVDFQGGREEIYRSVKMKFQVNHSKRPRPLSFNVNAYRNIRQISQLEHSSGSTEECCICLYALAPFQALFVSPCTHTFHFKCIRPLLSSYPGFQCPICRKYSDLEANLAVEVDDAEFSGQASPSPPPPLPALPVSSVLTPVMPSSALSPSSGQERTSNITYTSSPSSSEDEDDSPPSPHVYSNNDLAEISRMFFF
jgi:hypothetical protein